MYYYIKNTLEKTKKLDLKGRNGQFVAVLTSVEWLENRERFDIYYTDTGPVSVPA